MKTSKVLAVAVLGVSFALVGNAIAQVAGGFQGPGISDSTVADALKLPDDTPVVLKGKVEKSLGNEKYQFNDGTGVIVVEIDENKQVTKKFREGGGCPPDRRGLRSA